jgi:hypothetical protein
MPAGESSNAKIRSNGFCSGKMAAAPIIGVGIGSAALARHCSAAPVNVPVKFPATR